MFHLTDGQLRAHLDSELPAPEARHLTHCRACQARLDGLASQRRTVAQRLEALAPPGPALAPQAAWRRYQQQYLSSPAKENSPMTRSFWTRLRPLAALGVTIVLVLAAFTFSPVQQAFSAFLGLFRVQQIAILPIDPTGLNDLAGDEAMGQQLSRLFADSLTVTQKPGEPRTAASAAEAGQWAGFTVRTLAADLGPVAYTVSDRAAYAITVDQPAAQALIDELGRSDLQLPAALDGARISIDIPAGVFSTYGDCPSKQSDPDTRPAMRRALEACVSLVQVPSPTVNTPAEVDMAALAAIGLQLTGMDQAEAEAFSQSVDWATTLVVPIPRDAAVYQTVTVDGVTGQWVGSTAAAAQVGGERYTLLWTKAGVVYALSGTGTLNQALTIAAGLQ